MLRVAWLSLLLSLPAFAVEGGVTGAPEPPRFALSVATAATVSLAASVAAVAVTLAVPGACTAASGAPRPACSAAGVALGGALQLALTALVLPEAFRLSGLDPGAARAGWWRWARWPAAALAIATLAYLAATLVEQARYGAGQGAMLGSLGTTLASGLAVDVLGVIGAVRGARGLP